MTSISGLAFSSDADSLLAETFLNYAGALVLVLDKNGQIIKFNHACEKLSGLSFAEVEGKFPWDTVLPPEDADIIRKYAFEILANKPQSLSGSYTNYWLSKQGKRALIDWINTVVLDESGYMKYIVSVGTDVTEARHNEQMLQKSEARLNEAQSVAKVGSWELNLSNNDLVWTDEIFNIFEIDQSKFGASYEAFINSIHPDDREMVDQAYNNSLKNRMPYEIVHRLKMLDGRV
ncbi:MAG: PAS domain S-box protein, partial [Gammaproteobacteria bacterium]|nr:PAS domain S-box protein [Gammaproteobacteria bacterium]